MNSSFKYQVILFIAFFFLSFATFAQNKNIDSVKNLVTLNKDDTNKIKNLNKLCVWCKNIGEYGMALEYGVRGLNLSIRLNYKLGIASLNNNIGLIRADQSNYSEALKDYFSALKVYEELAFKKGIASTYNNIGVIYDIQKKYNEALKMHIASLKIKKEIKDLYGVATSYNNLGVIYKKTGKYDEASLNYKEALKILKEINDKQGIAYVIENMSVICVLRGDRELKNNNIKIATVIFKDAIKLQEEALKIKKEIDDKEGIITAYLNFGTLYTKLKNANTASYYLNEALVLSKEIRVNDILADCYRDLSLLDSLKGNYQSAYNNYKLYTIYRDSVYNEETKQKSLQSAMQYEFDKKELAAKAEKEKQEVISKEEKKKRELIIYIIGSVLLLIIMFTLVLYYRYKVTKRQKIIVELQKKQVDEAYSVVDFENTKLRLFNQEAQYKLLQDQINPHFLFNTLETISSLISNTPDLAKEFIFYLSDFLRVNIQNSESVVLLNEEVLLLKNYIELQTIRFGKAIQMDTKLNNDLLLTIKLPYFSLLTLIENAVKHNSFTVEKPLKITIEYNGEFIVVSNNIQAKKLIGKTTKSGINNLNERYKLLIGKEIIVQKMQSSFIVKLPCLKN